MYCKLLYVASLLHGKDGLYRLNCIAMMYVRTSLLSS